MERLKVVIIRLTPAEFDRLATVAHAQVREPEQQAEFWVKEKLRRTRIGDTARPILQISEEAEAS